MSLQCPDNLPWDCDTDDSLGGATQEYKLSPTPDDVTTPLGPDEILMDFTQCYTADYDSLQTRCIVAAWIYVISHMNQQNGTSGAQLPIRIRLIPIWTPPATPTVKRGVKK